MLSVSYLTGWELCPPSERQLSNCFATHPPLVVVSRERVALFLPAANPYLTHLCEADQEIREANELIQEFTSMLRGQKGECFDAWLEKIEQQGIPELCSFAQSLKKDYQAVKAGLTLSWSQGPVEGYVHRLKLLKRQAYGRAGFQTLHKWVLRCS